MPLMSQDFLDQVLTPGWEKLVEGELPRTTGFHDLLVLNDPWPHLVHYRGHRAHYTSPDQYFMAAARKPSDCIWIVPGTAERR